MQKTIKNLAAAFVGESQARNRYTAYAKAASKEGYEQISAIFLETAEQEREHAGWLMKMIGALKAKGAQDAEEIIVEAGVPTHFGSTLSNLQAAIAGENHEHTSMYPEFAQIAEEEGLPEVAQRLRAIAKAELHHESRYAKLAKELEAGTIFKKGEAVEWVCRKCGYAHTAAEAPIICPSCGHDQAYYQVACEQY